MRTRQGLPDDPQSRQVWLDLAETKRLLTPVQQAEFASYLLQSVIATFDDEPTWSDESVDSQLALTYAAEVLKQAGW